MEERKLFTAMKKYEEPILGIIVLNTQDIITQSFGDNDVDDDFDFGE